MTPNENGDRSFMRRALVLARHGLGWTDPNPAVGCLLVREGHVVGEGFHARAGMPHAETMALERAGPKAAGSWVFLTLEPCSHTGRTPPCADRLINAGVARVVVATADPDLRVQGKGIARLEEAGVAVKSGVLKDEAQALNAGFFKRCRTGWPWVTLKLATSLDGRTAAQTGENRWITSEAARADVHRLRHRHTAILTGSGTVLADDPALTARIPEGGVHPLRVVLDSSLRIAPSARVVMGPDSCVVFTGPTPPVRRRRALEDAGAEVISLPLAQQGGLDLAAIWRELGYRAINSVLMECGATLAGAALSGGWVDRLIAYQAPRFLGEGARPMLAGLPIEAMGGGMDLEVLERRAIGPDLRVTLRPGTALQA